MAIYLEALDSVIEAKRAEALGQYDLFDSTTGDEVTGLELKYPIEEWDKSTLLAHEREMLGLYVSDHPLLGIESTLAALVDRPISEISGDEVGHDDIVTIGGLVTSIQRKVTKAGASWAIVTIEDLAGAIDVMFFQVLILNMLLLFQKMSLLSFAAELIDVKTHRESWPWIYHFQIYRKNVAVH